MDRQLGLQQAELQKPNGWYDSAEVKENHGGEPGRRPRGETRDNTVTGLFLGCLFILFIFSRSQLNKERHHKEAMKFSLAIILIMYANPT